MPRRPARPVSWVYSPGVRNSWCSPVNFESFSITTDRAGMLIPSESVSVANTTLHQPGGEGLLHRLLHRRHHARVVGGDARPRSRPATRRSRARRGRRRRGASVCGLGDRRGCASRSLGSVRRSPAARHCWTASSHPLRLKMNAIAGSIACSPSSLDHLHPARACAVAASRGRPRQRRGHGRCCASSRAASGLGRSSPPGGATNVGSRWMSSLPRSPTR